MKVTMYKSDYTENNGCIVTKVQYKGQTILIAADAEDKEETDLVQRDLSLHADILRVGHHGSSTGTSERWLKAVKPTYAIISVGKNDKYGNPSQDLLLRLLDAHCSVWQTRSDGTIIATLDGTNITVTPEVLYDVSWRNANYIGNKSNHKLHTADCSSVPSNNNKEGFNTLEEALTAGYTEEEQCQRCRPFDH